MKYVTKVLPWATLGLVVLALPLVVRNPYYLSIIILYGITLFAVLGLDLLLGYAGQLSLGTAAFVGIGAYASGLVTVRLGLSPWLGFFTGIVVSTVVAAIVGMPSLKLKGYYLAMATLGFPVVTRSLLEYFQGLTGGASGLVGIPPFSLAGYPLENDQGYYYLILGLLLLFGLVLWNITRSRLGNALLALHVDEVTAEMRGVNTAKYKLVAFMVSAALASISGSLYAHYIQFIAPDNFDASYSILLVVMLVVGGMGKLWGAMLGTAFLTALPELLRPFRDWQPIIYGLILVLVILYLPNGLVGWKLPRKRYIVRPGNEKSRPELRVISNRSLQFDIISGKKHDFQGTGDMLKVSGLSKRFRGLQAVSAVDFTVRQGQIKSIIGPNGAGKSTILNLISGLEHPDSGSIELAGKQLVGKKPHQLAGLGLGRTFQQCRLFPNLTILDNIAIGSNYESRLSPIEVALGLPKAFEDQRRVNEYARELLAWLGIDNSAGRYPGELTQRDRRMAEIACTLATGPQLLLLDEPAAGFTQPEITDLGRVIVNLKSLGMTILLVEHKMELVLEISDEIIVLNYGQKIADGLPLEIVNNLDVRTAYLGQEGIYA